MDKRSAENRTPISLVEVGQQTCEVADPFNPQTTLHKPSHFPSPFDLWRQGEYLFVTRVGGWEVGCCAAYSDDTNRIVLHVNVPEAAAHHVDICTIGDELARRLGLSVTVDGYSTLWKSDTILSRLPQEMLGARPSSPFSLYEFLVICTLLQNTTVHRTVQMANALAHNLGKTYRFPNGDILYGFWKPADLLKLGESRLRELRVGYRAKTLMRFSEQFQSNPDLETQLLGLQNDLETLRAKIDEIYGVGPASVAYIMFEWFKCVNEFNHVSPWERKILSKLLFDNYDLPAAGIIQFCCKRWAPYTMLAVHALFEAVFWRREKGIGPEWLDGLVRM